MSRSRTSRRPGVSSESGTGAHRRIQCHGCANERRQAFLTDPHTGLVDSMLMITNEVGAVVERLSGCDAILWLGVSTSMAIQQQGESGSGAGVLTGSSGQGM